MFLLNNIYIEKHYYNFYDLKVNKGHNRMSQWLSKCFAIKLFVLLCHLFNNKTNQGLNWCDNSIKPLE